MKESVSYITINIIFILTLVLIASIRYFNSPYNSVNNNNENFNEYILRHPYEKGFQRIIRVKNVYLNSQNINFGDEIYIELNKCNPKYNLYFCDDDAVHILSESKLSSISVIRDAIIQRVENHLYEPYSSLVLGMTIGYQPNFTEDYEQKLISTGIMHIIVASGYNVNILITLLLIIKGLFRINIPFLAISSILILYSLIVGIEIPILRATIMGIFILYARYTGYRPSISYLLLLSSLLIIIFDPTSLRSVSFWLSFIAVIFIYIGKFITKNLTVILSDSVILFLIHIGLFPILIYFFGEISRSSFIVNLIISPLIPIITIIGFIFMIFPMNLLEIVLVTYIDFIESVIDIFSNIPMISVNMDGNISYLIYYYLIVFFIVYIIFRFIKKRDQETY